MTKRISTKKALIASLLSLMLCVSMLVGSTFAWFTDTATTGVNTIQAGNLDVALEMMDNDGNWVSAEGKTLQFLVEGKIPAEGTQILWEPGCTYALPRLRVVNAGNLALKYKVAITGIDGSAKLNEAIDWAITGTEDSTLTAGESHEFSISGHMKEDAGNEYKNLKIDGISITVYATQYTYEKDSKDDQYDKDAPYPVLASNQDELNDAITNATDKKATIALPAGVEFTLDNGIANEGDNSRDITFIGDGTQTIDVVTNAVNAEGGELNYQRGSTFTFENLTIQAGEGNFDGIVCDELVYRNCTIKGKLTLYGKATFINCTFENDMANQYSIWTWGGTDVTFDGCTFNTNGKAILLYGRAAAEKPTNLVVNNCTFNDKTGTAGKAAIEVGNDYNATYTLTVNNAKVNGFAEGKNTGSKLWANKNSMDAEHLTVTIDGTKVQ